MRAFYPWTDLVIAPMVFRPNGVAGRCSIAGRNEALKSAGTSTLSVKMPLNVRETEGGVQVVCFCPGADEERFDVHVNGDTVVIKGVIPATTEEENYLLQEVCGGEFSRSIKLPFEVDAGSVDAVFSKGILTISAKKVQVPTEKRIAIKVQ